MKKLSFITVIALLALAVAAVGAIAARKPVAFVGKYAGTATTTQSDTTIAISASGKGVGTAIGASKITGKGTGDSSQKPCVPFTGTGSMVGPGGTITFKVLPGSTSCGDDAGQLFSYSGKAAVLKATGKLKSYTGTLKMTGTYDRSSG